MDRDSLLRYVQYSPTSPYKYLEYNDEDTWGGGGGGGGNGCKGMQIKFPALPIRESAKNLSTSKQTWALSASEKVHNVHPGEKVQRITS